MLSTSFEFRSKRPTLFKATLTLADGSEVELAGADVMANSATFSDAVSSDGSFDVGAAVINRFDVTLSNFDRRFDGYDFTGAVIVPHVGVQLDSGGEEWLRKGVYGIDQPDSYGDTIGLAALDNMRLLERPYSEVSTAYPATLREIVSDACARCGLTLANPDFAYGGHVVAARPDDSSLTCLAVVSFAAQASGNFARCDNMGRLELRWYDTSAFEGEDALDGDRFDDASPYASGDDAEGGTFLDYSDGDAVDGGAFDSSRVASVHAVSSATVMTDDVVITGVRVTACDERLEDGSIGDEGETALVGSEGYVLEVSGNPLVQHGSAAAVAAQIAARAVGMRFRPLDVSAVGSPAYEAGDPLVVTDRLQNQYEAYITSTTYRLGGFQAISCGAESPGRNRAASYSAATAAFVEARNAVRAERTARELATADLARQLSESSGLYMTEEAQPDGSTVYYMHDKPTLRESRVVWKMTADAFGVSTDGGATYPYGLDASGAAVLNRIYAVGINADYITTGALVVNDVNNNVLFLADADTKMVQIGGFTVLNGVLHSETYENGSLTSGIRVGTDGIVVQDANNLSLHLSAGGLLGFNGANAAGMISPAATGTGSNSEKLYGLQMRGDVIDLRAKRLTVKDDNTASGDSLVAASNSYTFHELQPVAVTENDQVVAITLRPYVTTETFTHGLLTGLSYVSEASRTVPLRSYVDSQIQSVANDMPTFTLVGTTLYINA